MKTEKSAGGIVVRKIRNCWHVLLMRDMNNSWTFPKGIIETGETPQETAEREISEEVSLVNLKFVWDLGTIDYSYRKNGLIQKTVHYYLFISHGKKQPECQKEEGIKDASFFRIEKAIRIIGYEKTNKPLLFKVQKIL
jgi:ADP-ribose pyrophosphatase YjhB (NUDIX family)